MDPPALSKEKIESFEQEGYLIFPSFLTPEHSEQIVRDIDRLRELRTGGYRERNSETNGTALIITLPKRLRD